MPKASKPNAFLYFMIDWKNQEEKKGRSFPNGLKDVQIDPDCNEQWKNLSEERKAYYKEQAKGKPAKKDKNVKRTGLGELLSEIERAQIKEQEFKDNMVEYITSTVNAAKEVNNVQNLVFYIFHANYFYSRTPEEHSEVEYYPAEISIAECSLQRGVMRVYHTIVNEKTKLGFTASAREYSANTHNIPINLPEGKSSYKEIFHDIRKFLEPQKINGVYPPVYTLHTKETVYYPIKSILSRLCVANQYSEEYILLYSLEDLFANLHNATIEQTGKTKIERIVAAIELKKDPFVYRLGLECDFHGTLKGGIEYCSESIVKRWFYVICNFCCEALEIKMIPGIHMPKEKMDPFVHIGKLNSSFSTLSLNESKRTFSSMSGVSNEYRLKVSERNYRDEERRRSAAVSKPIEIIDHSKLNCTTKPPEPLERPLRRPFTKSAAPYVDSTDTESLDFSDISFPSIGRGSAMKQKQHEKTVGQPISYASRLKKL